MSWVTLVRPERIRVYNPALMGSTKHRNVRRGQASNTIYNHTRKTWTTQTATTEHPSSAQVLSQSSSRYHLRNRQIAKHNSTQSILPISPPLKSHQLQSTVSEQEESIVDTDIVN